MKKFSGIDLHSNNSLIVVSDEADKVVYQRRHPNDLADILGALEPHRSELEGLVVESTYNWYWLVDGLMNAGYVVHLAHTAAIKKYEGLKYSGDEADAAYLAKTPASWPITGGVYFSARGRGDARFEPQAHAVGALSYAADAVDREHPGTPDGSRLKSAQVQRLTVEQIEELGFAPDVTLALQANAAVMRTLQSQIVALEERLQQRVRLSEDFALLKSVPGIGMMLATTIMLEVGTVKRFVKAGNFSSYCRCVQSLRVSNGKKKGEGSTKNGNKYLAWAFVEAAHFALRNCPQAKSFYERKKHQRNAIVASKALAHKLARASYHMLRERKAFEVARCFA